MLRCFIGSLMILRVCVCVCKRVCVCVCVEGGNTFEREGRRDKGALLLNDAACYESLDGSI